MKIFITGGNGFLGRCLSKRLVKEGHKVTVFSRTANFDQKIDGVKYISGDIKNRHVVSVACSGMDIVFHVAAKVGAWGRYKDYYESNVVGTDNVIFACQQNKVKKLVYTSSPSVVFGREEIRCGDERLPYPDNYMSHYQHTKAEAERRVLGANNPPSLMTTALRPHAIWGVGDNHLIPRVIQMGSVGKLKIVGAGNNKISMTHIENAAAAHIQAAMSENVGGKAYFINDPNPVVLWKWIATVLERLGYSLPKRKVPFFVAYTAASFSELMYRLLPIMGEPKVTRYVVSLLSKDHYFNTKNAENDFNYQPVITADIGLQELIQHLLLNTRISDDGERSIL